MDAGDELTASRWRRLAAARTLRLIRVAWVLLVASLLVTSADADVLLERVAGTPLESGTSFSDRQMPFPQETASRVLLDFTSVVDALVWQGAYFGLAMGGAAPFVVRVYQSDTTGPMLSPFYELSVEATLTEVAFGDFVLEASLSPPVLLSAGVSYWISIVDDDATRPRFGWRESIDPGTSVARSSDGDAWGLPLQAGSLTLLPEPRAVAPAIAIALAVLRRRRTRS